MNKQILREDAYRLMWQSPGPGAAGPPRVATRCSEELRVTAVMAASLISEQRYPADLRAPGSARAHVRAQLAKWGLGGLADAAELVTAELVTNAVVHGEGDQVVFGLVRTARGVIMLAADRSRGIPVPGDSGGLAESGRGLALVEALCGRWGHYFAGGNGGWKIVWGELQA